MSNLPTKTINTSDIIYDKNIYPRDKVDMTLVSQYRDSIDELPSIEVDLKNRIIDGYHRLHAFRAEEIDAVTVEVFESDDDVECLIESIRRNAKHGKQLTPMEKKVQSRDLYAREIPESDIREIVGVSERTISTYLKDLKDAEDESRDTRILEMYLACCTRQEIADEIDVPVDTIKTKVRKIVGEIGNTSEITQPPESLQHTNLWEFTACDPEFGEKKYPGRMPGQIIENLVWYYTKPFDVVYDPMAGGGTTLDVCRKMYRRVAGFDINPIEPKGVKQNDIMKGLPRLRIKDKPMLIVLDPPYSIQKKDKYTKHDTDLSNMTIDNFYDSIGFLADNCGKLLHTDGVVAFIISSLKNNGAVEDLGVECRNIFTDHEFDVMERICVPYNNAESMTGYWIANAKKNKWMLRAYRDLLILKPHVI